MGHPHDGRTSAFNSRAKQGRIGADRPRDGPRARWRRPPRRGRGRPRRDRPDSSTARDGASSPSCASHRPPRRQRPNAAASAEVPPAPIASAQCPSGRVQGVEHRAVAFGRPSQLATIPSQAGPECRSARAGLRRARRPRGRRSHRAGRTCPPGPAARSSPTACRAAGRSSSGMAAGRVEQRPRPAFQADAQVAVARLPIQLRQAAARPRSARPPPPGSPDSSACPAGVRGGRASDVRRGSGRRRGLATVSAGSPRWARRGRRSGRRAGRASRSSSGRTSQRDARHLQGRQERPRIGPLDRPSRALQRRPGPDGRRWPAPSSSCRRGC